MEYIKEFCVGFECRGGKRYSWGFSGDQFVVSFLSGDSVRIETEGTTTEIVKMVLTTWTFL